jgi:hypothetical protein
MLLTPAQKIRLNSELLMQSADKSHLEPPAPRLYYARVDWEKVRETSRPRLTASLLYIPPQALHPFFKSEDTV